MISLQQHHTPLKWDARQRLALLKPTVMWEGRVTTGGLIRLFGISRGQAKTEPPRVTQ